MKDTIADDPGIPIPLTKGYVAFVSPEDFERVNAYRWCAAVTRTTVYAKRGEYRAGKHVTVRMHRFILGAPNGFDVDHADRDGLNNRRSNLRLATDRQNKANSVKRRRNTSGYKGIYRDRSGWIANSQQRYIGTYDTAEEAARAYDTAELRAFGDFARLNFPDDFRPVEPRSGGPRRSNTSGYAGVSFRKDEGKWIARIPHDGRRLFLGYFNSAELAAEAIALKRGELDANKGNQPE